MIRRRRAAGLAALAVAVAVAVAVLLIRLSSTGPPARRTRALPVAVPPRLRLGASVNRLFNDQTYSPAQIAAQLGALRATGATVARSDALWGASQPLGPGTSFDWRFDDALVGALATHGLQWLPIVDYSAPWAEATPGNEHSPPRSDEPYAAFAAALAARYGAGGRFWSAHPELPPMPVDTLEIWNEPDNPGFWFPAPDPAGYARLYLASRSAIKHVDPAARVIVGGLTAPRSFLPALISALPALRNQVDGVAIHPYAPEPAGVAARVRTARQVLRALGLGTVPLYVTEFGWTTSPPGALDYAPAERRPGYITRTLAALGHSDCMIAEAFLYTWVTPDRNRRLDQDWFGISPPGATGSPDTAAFAAGLRQASGSGPVTLSCS